MNDEYWELLEAVLTDRKADPPRLAMADWFEQHDQPHRAKFIRDRLADRTVIADDLSRFSGTMFFRPDWSFEILASPRPFNIYWARGFISRIVCDFRTWERVSVLSEWHRGPRWAELRLIGDYVKHFDPHPIETVVLTDHEFPSRRTPFDFNRAVTADGKLDWEGGCTCDIWPGIRFHLYADFHGGS